MVESACAPTRTKSSLAGRSGSLLERYLIAFVRVFQGDPAARVWIARMLGDPHTFEHMGRFVTRIAASRERSPIGTYPGNSVEGGEHAHYMRRA